MAAVAPVVAEVAFEFAEDLLEVARDNDSRGHSDELKELLEILLAETEAPTDTGSAPPPGPTPTAGELALDVAIAVQHASEGGFSAPAPIEDASRVPPPSRTENKSTWLGKVHISIIMFSLPCGWWQDPQHQGGLLYLSLRPTP